MTLQIKKHWFTFRQLKLIITVYMSTPPPKYFYIVFTFGVCLSVLTLVRPFVGLSVVSESTRLVKTRFEAVLFH